MSISLKNIGFIGLGTALVLCIPLIAMQFTQEVRWSTSDFVVAGILLFGLAFLCDLTWRNIANRTFRTLLLIGIILLFFLTWAELAVGVFGSPLAGS